MYTNLEELYHAFYEACLGNDVNKVVELLQDPNIAEVINRPNQRGETPLFLACKSKHETIVRKLLENPFVSSINQPDETGETPLSFAGKNNCEKIINCLFEHPDILITSDILNRGGPNLVMHIYRYESKKNSMNYLDRLKHLLYGDDFDVNMVNEDGCSLIYLAAKAGLWELVNILFEHKNINLNHSNGNSSTPDAYQLFHIFLRDNEDFVIRMLKDSRIDLTLPNIKDGRTIFHEVCDIKVSERMEIEFLKLLKVLYPEILRNRVINEDDDLNVYYERFKKIAMKEIAIKTYGHTLFSYPQYLKPVIKNSPKVNERNFDINQKDLGGNSILFLACAKNKIRIVKHLLAIPEIDVNSINIIQQFPLLKAIESNNVSLVRILLADKRLNVNQVDKKGWSAFFLACHCGYLEIVRILMEDGRADINQSNFEGVTPIQWAFIQKKYGVYQELIKDPWININHITTEQETLFDFTLIRPGDFPMAKSLLSHPGMDLTQKILGKTYFARLNQSTLSTNHKETLQVEMMALYLLKSSEKIKDVVTLARRLGDSEWPFEVRNAQSLFEKANERLAELRQLQAPILLSQNSALHFN